MDSQKEAIENAKFRGRVDEYIAQSEKKFNTLFDLINELASVNKEKIKEEVKAEQVQQKNCEAAWRNDIKYYVGVPSACLVIIGVCIGIYVKLS